jgi:hypothetical protein
MRHSLTALPEDTAVRPMSQESVRKEFSRKREKRITVDPRATSPY